MRHRLLGVPARLVRHAHQVTLRHPGTPPARPGAVPATTTARLDLRPTTSPTAHHGDPRTRRVHRDITTPTTRTSTHSIDIRQSEPINQLLHADSGLRRVHGERGAMVKSMRAGGLPRRHAARQLSGPGPPATGTSGGRDELVRATSLQ
jgi:hypothetical protein